MISVLLSIGLTACTESPQAVAQQTSRPELSPATDSVLLARVQRIRTSATTATDFFVIVPLEELRTHTPGLQDSLTPLRRLALLSDHPERFSWVNTRHLRYTHDSLQLHIVVYRADSGQALVALQVWEQAPPCTACGEGDAVLLGYDYLQFMDVTDEWVPEVDPNELRKLKTDTTYGIPVLHFPDVGYRFSPEGVQISLHCDHLRPKRGPKTDYPPDILSCDFLVPRFFSWTGSAFEPNQPAANGSGN